MPSRRLYTTIMFASAISVFLPLTPTRAGSFAATPQGIIVESVGMDSTLAAAGLKKNDILISWRRPGHSTKETLSKGAFESPFDLVWLIREQAPRGLLILTVRREEALLTISVLPGLWEAEVRPAQLPQDLEQYLRALADGLGSSNENDRALGQIAKISEGSGISAALKPWLYFRLANTWAEEKSFNRALPAYEASLTRASNLRARTAIQFALAKNLVALGRLKEAGAYYDRAASEIRTQSGQCLALAAALERLGDLADQTGQLASARELWNKSLLIRKRLAPRSLEMASSLNNLGNLEGLRGNFKTSLILQRRALAIRIRLAPTSHLTAASHVNIGRVLAAQGQSDLAEEEYTRALALIKTGPAASTALINLGIIAGGRGDLAQAKNYFERAQALEGEHGSNLSIVYLNLGTLNKLRGDFELAEDYLRRALSIQQDVTGGRSHVTAGTLLALGNLALERDDFELAQEYLTRSISIVTNSTPKSDLMESLLVAMGRLARRQGDLRSAEEYYKKALQLSENLGRGSSDKADILINLGTLAGQRRDFPQAKVFFQNASQLLDKGKRRNLSTATLLVNLGILEKDVGTPEHGLTYLKEALDIRTALAPDSMAQVDSLQAIADVLKVIDRPDESLSYYLRALEALEKQIGRLGDTGEDRARLRKDNKYLYINAADMSLSRGKVEAAFDIIERYRARSFLNLLAEKDLTLEEIGDSDIERAHQRLVARHEKVQAEILKLDLTVDKKQVERLSDELLHIRRDLDDTLAKIRKTSPRLAALKYPEPLSSDGVQEVLDPGTLLLAFYVGDKSSTAFSLSRLGPVRVKKLPTGEDEVRLAVDRMRELIRFDHTQTAYGEMREKEFLDISEHLFDLLIRPFEEQIAASSRLLIIADGPLHFLPWEALVHRSPGYLHPDRNWRYLVEWKPVHIVLSASVYAELSKLRPSQMVLEPPVGSFVGFGDAIYPQSLSSAKDEPTDSRVRSAIRRGFRFEPLPSTRVELERIAHVFDEHSKIYLGADATEERAKSLPRKTGIVHFATHATLDERFPLNSALVFSIPEKFEEGHDNGLLQAWEIFEKVRLDADLVVLSACESGLGKEMGGEGLIGLTRAFQYAGARSVMASLWKISDRTTAELMVRFYKHLKDGMPKDEALRAAQMELIQGPIRVRNEKGEEEEIDASAPYYWAAFQIYGDWQ